MSVPVQAFLQCPYRYWHPYSNNASTDMKHVIIADTSTVIHMMAVLVIFIFANHANTSTGISPMPILAIAQKTDLLHSNQVRRVRTSMPMLAIAQKQTYYIVIR